VIAIFAIVKWALMELRPVLWAAILPFLGHPSLRIWWSRLRPESIFMISNMNLRLILA
jgi:hypothetical protein